jgi:hypothetical protein
MALQGLNRQHRNLPDHFRDVQGVKISPFSESKVSVSTVVCREKGKEFKFKFKPT